MHIHVCSYACMCSTGNQTLAICIVGKLCSTSVALVFVSVLLRVKNKTLLHESG